MAVYERRDSIGNTSRRAFLGGAAALSAFGPALARAAQGNTMHLAYVGSYSSPEGPEGSKGNGQGIYLFEMDSSTGAFSPRAVFPNGSNPSWLALDPSRTHLYAANERRRLKELPRAR